MARPAPIAATALQPGRLARLKLTEPVRLYLWPVALLLPVAGLVAGIRDGDWWRAGILLAAALLVVLVTEFARASVYSPRTVVQTVLHARGQ